MPGASVDGLDPDGGLLEECRHEKSRNVLGDASITGDINNKRLIKGALFGSCHTARCSLTPAFKRYLVYGSGLGVGEDVTSIDIKPEVLAKDYKSMTINGKSAVSREPSQS
ncbi:MAG: hypothetical protein MZV63_32905 [Marinilabiliales bacterium]|nr:hypothetical protein [Marinilabiliales bacterium]